MARKRVIHSAGKSRSKFLSSTSPSAYRLMTPAELERRGYSKGSKRRVLASVKRVTANTPTFSDRQVAQKKISERIGKQTSKEQFRELVRKGEAKYTPNAAHRSDSKFIRDFLPDVAPRDMTLMLKYYDSGGRRGRGYDGLNDKEKQQFRNLFRRYSRDDVRQALGSAPQDTGAFAVG